MYVCSIVNIYGLIVWIIVIFFYLVARIFVQSCLLLLLYLINLIVTFGSYMKNVRLFYRMATHVSKIEVI